jgi:hypothetical protein
VSSLFVPSLSKHVKEPMLHLQELNTVHRSNLFQPQQIGLYGRVNTSHHSSDLLLDENPHQHCI